MLGLLRSRRKRIAITALLVILSLTSLMVGSLGGVTPGALAAGDKTAWSVLWYSRLPRTAAIILSAAGLSAAGMIMQAISRNKFMSPSTSGTTDAAALGLLLSFVLLNRQPGLVQLLFAFVFALAASALFTTLLSRLKLREAVYIPLVGMMYGGLISSVTTAIAYRFDVMQMMSAIALGSFARLGSFTMVYVVIAPLFFAVLYATRFSIIGLGEDFAKNLGLSYKRVVFTGLVIIALVSASTFVSVGPLPFVGLIIPNMAASFYGDNLKKSIVDLMLFGADFVLVCDILSRLVIYPFEMSVSLTISVAGGAIFMFYLLRRMYVGKKREAA
ncbi:MAG: iron chelate uptake ABC transporter family permease subunit [Oscillospiraceae bacterium]|nr:iron chelate uptake ABC transporter family permease subunit [Oscillospiraceae bacterium]